MPDETIDLESLRRTARAAGFEWSDAELEDVRPLAAAVLDAMRALEAADTGDAEPSVLYRAV